MSSKFIWIQVLLLCYINYSSCNCSCDYDTTTHDAQTCKDYFITFENALLTNGSNLYKLKEMFLKDPPELVNVTYYLQFIKKGSIRATKLPACSCSAENASTLTVFRNTTGTVVLRYGWTSIGVYVFIHPALLNQLQIQLPFYILRKIANNNHPLLWDGYNQLPSIHLHLSIPITSLTCVPYTNQLDGVIKRLTSLVSKIIINYCMRL